MNHDQLIHLVLKKFTALNRLGLDCKFGVHYRHVKERITNRSINVLDVDEAIRGLLGVCRSQFLPIITQPNPLRPFRIKIRHKNVILSISRRDDDWFLTTVLDPKKHDLHNNERDTTFEQWIVV